MSTTTITLSVADRDRLVALLGGSTPAKEAKVTPKKKAAKKAAAKKAPAKAVTLTCEDCGQDTPRNSANQKRCPECRATREEAFLGFLSESHDAREARKSVNAEMAAWLREKGLPTRGPVWDEAKAGSRSVTHLRKVARESGTEVKAPAKKAAAPKIAVDADAKAAAKQRKADIAALRAVGFTVTQAEAALELRALNA